jgi:hypothetical protein
MVVGNSLEAETICGLLRTEGIACDHRHTYVGAGAGDAIGGSGPREILGARDDHESARQLLFRENLHDLQRAVGMEPFMEPSGYNGHSKASEMDAFARRIV